MNDAAMNEVYRRHAGRARLRGVGEFGVKYVNLLGFIRAGGWRF